MTEFLHHPPKNLFLTGKGGVGKTTTSAATAIASNRRAGYEQLRLLLKNNGFAVALEEKKKSGCGCGPGCC